MGGSFYLSNCGGGRYGMFCVLYGPSQQPPPQLKVVYTLGKDYSDLKLTAAE